MTILGSRKKKKRNNRANRGGNYSGTPRSAQNDKYAKYAGAVSNKSKRNYADLKLVRPDNLKEYASENARPRATQSSGRSQGQRQSRHAGNRSAAGSRRQPPPSGANEGGQRTAAPSGTRRNTDSRSGQRPANVQRARSLQTAANRGRSAGGFGEAIGSLGAWVGSVSSGAVQTVAGKGRQGRPLRQNSGKKPPKAASSGRAPRDPKYAEDEYSKALNNADFYGDILGKYSMKYADDPTVSQSAARASVQYTEPKSRKVRRQIKNTLNGMPPDDKASQKPQKSIAELAVRNRSTAGKRKYAKVVKTGKAKGSVPIGPVHRKVHRRDRRQSLFIGAAAVSSAALVMLSVIFFAFFKVKKIEVAGETPYSDSRITELCEFSKGDNLMFIDTVNSEQQVLDALPYIESCQIRRTIPNVVEVNVTCANTLGVAEIGSGFWSIVSTGGKILENVTNVVVVSSSDVVMSVSYEPDIRSVEELAAAKELPVLSGLEFKDGKVGEYVIHSSVDSVNGFDKIVKQAGTLGMRFTKLKYTSRGFEAEYDGRINIVLGDWADDEVLKKRIQVANYIICEQGDISEHEMGELTFLKNQTVFSPTYDISDEDIVKSSEDGESEIDALTKFAESLLDKGIDVKDEPSRRKEEEESSPPADNPVGDITNSNLPEILET